ncbi:MAG: hypothetical protein JW967_00700 [Dehalococcoidales bacterium]|nr:hypothetical protein [Dehalococcoidales bacterium]
MMKKGLLIWNVIVTVIALVLILGACTSDPTVDWCVSQIQTQAMTISQLQNDINTLESANSQLTVYIQNQEGRIVSLESTMLQVVTRLNAQ